MASKIYTLLVLGDSYSIGEGVGLHETFSYQSVQLLRKAGLQVNAPEILAQTGWTSSDLRKAVRDNRLLDNYNFVSLLIGVNDQYQAKNTNDFAVNFEQLLKQAILLSGNNPSNVFVLSIPDWGQTPFAAGRDRQQITEAIGVYNRLIKQLCLQYKALYIALEAGNELLTDASMLAADELHPSKKEYAKWAVLLSDEILKRLA